VGRIASVRRALAAVGSLPILVLRITNGLAMISLVYLCSDREHPLRFPLGGREFATVLCKLATVVYLLSLFGGPCSPGPPLATTRRAAPRTGSAPPPPTCPRQCM
jgi:hydroxymethylglutaryl-CoA reductase (NADPH)